MILVSRVSFIFMLLILSTSCKSQEETVTEVNLKECINEKVNNDIKGAYGKEPFDFYKFILEIENKLTEEKVLTNNKKESYLNLLKEIQKSQSLKHNEARKKLIKISDQYGFGFNLFTINDAIFNQCPYKASKDNKDGEGKLIYSQGVILNKLMAQGYSNEPLLKELINITDDGNFEKIVYRAPIILLVMINLDNKYNPDLKQFKEQQ